EIRIRQLPAHALDHLENLRRLMKRKGGVEFPAHRDPSVQGELGASIEGDDRSIERRASVDGANAGNRLGSVNPNRFDAKVVGKGQVLRKRCQIRTRIADAYELLRP